MKKVIQLIVKHAICNTLKGLFRYFRTQCDKNRQGDIKQRKREKEMRGREGGGHYVFYWTFAPCDSLS